jgi:hypothetical protein
MSGGIARRVKAPKPAPEPAPEPEAEPPADDLDAGDVRDAEPQVSPERHLEPPGALDDPEEHFVADDHATPGTTTDRAPDTDD